MTHSGNGLGLQLVKNMKSLYPQTALNKKQQLWQVPTASRDPSLLFCESQCLSAAAHKESNTSFQKKRVSLGDKVCPGTNDKEPHYSSLALASVGMKLRDTKTPSIAMSCSCQRTGMWTSQAQEEEKCYYNPGQLSNFRVSIWQHKSRWP